MKTTTLFFLVFSIIMITGALAQDTLFLQPGPEGKDAIVNDYYTTNYGDYPNLFALAGTHSGIPIICRSLFEFDLSAIPRGSEILEAKLSLYFANNPSNPDFHYGENAAFLQRIIEPWDEHSVTWWNQPQATEQHQALLPASHYETQNYTNINVRSLIQDIVNDPENSHGILFRLQVEEMYRRMFFASGDHENPLLRPEIEVIYVVCTPPSVDFEYMIGGQDVNFTGICPTANSWLWDFGDGYLSVLQNPVHYYQETGFYEVCLTVEDSCGTAQFCETIQVCDLPLAGFDYVSDGLTVNFQDTSRFADHYFWSFGDGFYSDLPEPVRTYDSAGYYQVCLETWNDCGSDSVCQMIFVDYSGLMEPASSHWSIYPNPADDEVFFKTLYSGTTTLTLHDLGGREVVRQIVELKAGEIFRLGLPGILPGVYILRIDMEENQFYRKLVIAR